MRAASIIGGLIALLGLTLGPLGYMLATNVIQQAVCALGTVTGVLGLMLAVLGHGLADLREIARRMDNTLTTMSNRLEAATGPKFTEWRPKPRDPN